MPATERPSVRGLANATWLSGGTGGRPLEILRPTGARSHIGRGEKPRILVDVHELKGGVPAILEELGAQVETAPLPAGDYAVGADTLVERKRVLDLHSAVIKGHFWPQLGKLKAGSAFPYLLVEGTDLDRGPLSANAVRGACLAAIDNGIALLRTDQQRDTALWLHRLAIRCQRSEPAAERPAYAQRPKPLDSEVAETLLAAIPGISTAGARALLARFGSVSAVAAADPAEWLTVQGIGRERANALAVALGVPSNIPQ